MGKPMAFIGHKVQCPKCRGVYPIADGVLTTTFYGKGVAVAGMKTACGAVLIASQFTDIAEWSSGAGIANSSPQNESRNAKSTSTSINGTGQQADGLAVTPEEAIEIETFYSLTDGAGNPLEHYRYDLHVEDQLHTKAGTYTNGKTVVITDEASSQLVTWLNRDSILRA
jgi:hypothetical protein